MPAVSKFGVPPHPQNPKMDVVRLRAAQIKARADAAAAITAALMECGLSRAQAEPDGFARYLEACTPLTTVLGQLLRRQKQRHCVRCGHTRALPLVSCSVPHSAAAFTAWVSLPVNT